VKLRRVDLDAFDRKLAELSGGTGRAAEQNLNRLSERRASLEEEIVALEKHVDDLRFLSGSLEKLKGESQSRDQLQNEAMNQIKIIEDARAILEVQVHQLKRARQELADVIEVMTGVTVPAPAVSQGEQALEDSGELSQELSTELPAEGEDVTFD
jgi:DNA repair exonuclease SbcCD ATPase subunit